ncbi:hypothetical protein JYU19_02760, partial [bacterium AH-315-J21]|nr:hypothetical protein [bacterium AH-315-J21]
MNLGIGTVPEQIKYILFIVMLGAGIWFSARRRRSKANESYRALTIALFLSLIPTALLGLSSGGPANVGLLDLIASLLPFTISPALFGVLAEKYIRKQKTLVNSGNVSLLVAFLFIIIGALIISRMFAATFGLAATMEFGLVILGVTGTLQMVYTGFNRIFGNSPKKAWTGR